MNSCVECGRCTDNCPANAIGGSLDPKRIVLQMQRGLLAGGDRIAGDETLVASGEAWVSEQDLYQCPQRAERARRRATVGIEHVGLKILDLRRGLVSEGRTGSDKLADMFTTRWSARRTTRGVSPQQVRRKLVANEGLPAYGHHAEWLFWLGCGCNFDPHGQDVVRSMQRILDSAGVSWGVLESETCCGEPARRTGNEYLYLELSERVIAALRSARVSQDRHVRPALRPDVRYRLSPAGGVPEPRDRSPASLGTLGATGGIAAAGRFQEQGHVPRPLLPSEGPWRDAGAS